MKHHTRLIDDLKKHPIDKEIFVVGSNGGWEYLLSNNKISKGLANYMLYSDIMSNGKKTVVDMPNYLIEDHIKLMNKNKGFIFWIDSSLVKSVNSKDGLVASERLLKLLSISRPVENLGKFYRYEIK